MAGWAKLRLWIIYTVIHTEIKFSSVKGEDEMRNTMHNSIPLFIKIDYTLYCLGDDVQTDKQQKKH